MMRPPRAERARRAHDPFAAHLTRPVPSRYWTSRLVSLVTGPPVAR
jgi:hypothetical protein